MWLAERLIARPWLLAILSWLVVASSAQALEPTGVWKMCFEPGLPDVDEPSAGYLVFMPDHRFFEIRADCCQESGELPSTKVGRYRVDGNTVFLGTAVDGRVYERQFEFVGRAAVVLFDDLDGEPIELPVLKIGRDLNYGFARIYPIALNQTTPSASRPRSPS